MMERRDGELVWVMNGLVSRGNDVTPYLYVTYDTFYLHLSLWAPSFKTIP